MHMTSIARKASAPINIKKVKPTCQIGTTRSYDEKQERPSFTRSLSERFPDRKDRKDRKDCSKISKVKSDNCNIKSNKT